jgi:hypothetical protein
MIEYEVKLCTAKEVAEWFGEYLGHLDRLCELGVDVSQCPTQEG